MTERSVVKKKRYEGCENWTPISGCGTSKGLGREGTYEKESAYADPCANKG